MLKIQKVRSEINEPPLLSRYEAILEIVDDKDLCAAMLAANINILRRNAPFAYLFSNEYPLDSWLKTSNNPSETNIDGKYVIGLEAIQLQKGVWFTNPDWEEKTTTVVASILVGDVLPFIDYLDEDKCCLLCLPDIRSLQELDQTILSSSSTRSALVNLLLSGGCLISAIDHRIFAVQTLDIRYAQYFTSDSSEEVPGDYPNNLG